jgi:hypothetical protein
LHTAAVEKCVGSNEEGIGALARKGGKGRIDLAAGAGFVDLNLQPDGAASFLHLTRCRLGDRRNGRN